MSLAGRAYSAARWTTVSTVLRAVLQILQVAVLARFLAPKEYGLMAMVSVVLSYAGLFSDMGLSTAFVQRQEISHEERSSLYWLSVAIGAILMFLVMAASPAAAMFFHEPELLPLMMLVATNFLVVSLGQQLKMDAEKSLDFFPVAMVEISSAVLGFSFAVTTAWLNWGVYALVAASMVSTWIAMLLSWVMLAKGWRPSWRMHWSEVQWFVRFGAGMVLNNVINHVNATIDLLIGGRLLGASQLGFYSVPRTMIMQVQSMVNPVITRVAFPLIASIQHDKSRAREVFLKTRNMTASVNAPIYVALAVFAPEIVFIVLGPKWGEVPPVMRVLALWGMLRSFGSPVGSMLFGLGHVRLATIWNAGLMLIVPPIVWYGSQYGTIGMAWAMASLMLVLYVPGWAILVRPTCGARFVEYTRQVAAPTFCAIVAGAAGWFVAVAFDEPLARLIIGLPVGAAIYLLLSWFINRSWVAAITAAIGSDRMKAFILQ